MNHTEGIRLNLKSLNFNSLIATSFFFCIKNIFYSENIHDAYNFYGTDLYVSVCRGLFRTQHNICVGASLRKLQKCLIADVRIGSNYTSSITFEVEKVSRMSIFVLYSERQSCQNH